MGNGEFLMDNNERKRGMEKVLDIFLSDVFYSYSFDVNDGVVMEDIIDRTGFNYTRAMGLNSPCMFDELIERSFDASYQNLSYAYKPYIEALNCASLIMAYYEGNRKIEMTVQVNDHHMYHRLTFMLTMDDETGHIIAYVYCQDVTDIQESNIRQIADVKQELIEIDNIISSAGIGIWKIELFDGNRPKMYGSAQMYKILGVDPDGVSPEAIYVAWYSRIKRSSLPIVDAVIGDMIDLGRAESTYRWVHPQNGDIYVRCGGTSYRVEGKGVVLRGYFYDVTDVTTTETKQKELLAEALEETQNQKTLLQQALDDYKQADYDRRTDFLTGLRNRQDMFELLHDSLSMKREQIKTMFMMDIDNFKMLNDRYGHTYGDECLKRIGEALLQYGKENGMYFYRYGGEEILGIGFTNPKSDRQIADELVKLIYDLGIKRDDLETGVVTISLGFTSNNKRYEKMIDKADTAMYHAKSEGKNRAVCFEDIK